jgi:hypothetical protein
MKYNLIYKYSPTLLVVSKESMLKKKTAQKNAPGKVRLG